MICRQTKSTPRYPLVDLSINATFPKVALFRLTCKTIDALQLPNQPGSAIRGLFGYGLKEAVCVTGLSRCNECALYRRCAYPYLFETPPPERSERLRLYKAVPHPYVIRSSCFNSTTLSKGEIFHFDIVLIGKGINLIAEVILAFRRAGTYYGLGPKRSKFELSSVSQYQFEDRSLHQIWYVGQQRSPQVISSQITIPPIPSGTVRVVLDTPLRLIRDKKPISPSAFQFHDFFRSVMRRISSLSYFHGHTPLDIDFKSISKASRAVVLADQKLHHSDTVRFSSRQRSKLKIGGLMGTFDLESSCLVPYWPYLVFGQIVHAGKATVMGFGQYRITHHVSRGIEATPLQLI